MELKCLVTLSGKAVEIAEVGFINSAEHGFIVFAKLEDNEALKKLLKEASRVCGSCDSFAPSPLFGATCCDEVSLAQRFRGIRRADTCNCWKTIAEENK